MGRKATRKSQSLPGIALGVATGKVNPAVGAAAAAAFDKDGKPRPAVHKGLLRAVEVQRPLVIANLRALHKRHPHDTAAELSKRLERNFLLGVSGGGAAIGATAIMPGIGTVASLSISVAATGVFLEATALYALSIAELHGVSLEDPERARITVMAIILGDEGTALLTGMTGHALGNGKTSMQAWGNSVNKSLPVSSLKAIATSMQKKFLKRLAVQSSASVLGKALPFGIGAVVGGTGNYMMGKAVVKSTERAFGAAPVAIPARLLAELKGTVLPEPTPAVSP